MTEDTHNPVPTRSMSAHDFALWGMQDIAYIKRVVVNDEVSWAIHGADGRSLGLAPERTLAFAAVRQHDLEPVSVH
ncbi:MAG TPA: DUF1150 family protein [Rhodospirillaceae bacterium]|nr:DUF1150 family protein [Rhodospirillaceae bacterium]